MHKSFIIPKLAVTALLKNKRAYIPYMLITSFAVFVFFIFNAISTNEIMFTLPHANYIAIFMEIGKVLLAIILIPILITTNQFLVKQRKSELGLYNILGLDQKDIGVMMVYETGLVYGLTLALGLLCATFFSKLIYLLLLNITKLPIDIPFEGSLKSYSITIIFFGILACMNLVINLYQVLKAKPIELMKGSRKGEKNKRFLGIKSILGIGILGCGYYIASITQVDSMIFINFFLAVMLVIVGTRILFEAGTISLLNTLKSRPKIYYKKENFITLSGMIYRMKRNAQNLSSICIFCTMIMVTLICTVAVFRGQDEALDFQYPQDVVYGFDTADLPNTKDFKDQIKEKASKHQIKVTDLTEFEYQGLSIIQNNNQFLSDKEEAYRLPNAYDIRLITLSDYNRMEEREAILEEDEVLIYSSHRDFGYDTLQLGESTYKVKEELQSLKVESKNTKSMGYQKYYVVLPSEEHLKACAKNMKKASDEGKRVAIGFNIDGEIENQEAFIEALNSDLSISHSRRNRISWEKQSYVLNGGLLFLGLFFGIIFSVCVLLIMYYKQVSEGFEDQKNFKVLKQVGMSDNEISKTIRRQILMVFFLPLIVAIIHTLVALQIIENLLGVLFIYNHRMILFSSYSVIVCFTILYVISYLFTGRAYYKIVK